MDNNASAQKQYVDDNEARISKDENIYWHNIYQLKDRRTALLSIWVFISLAAGLIIGYMEDVAAGIYIPVIMLCLAGFICIAGAKGRAKASNHVLVTDKKLLAYMRIMFWFTYDEVLDCKIKRGPLDLMFDTGTAVVTVIHTWASVTTRQVVRRAKGKLTIRGLKDAEGFRQALLKAKKDSGHKH